MSTVTERKVMIDEARRLEDDYGDNYEVMSHMSKLADEVTDYDANLLAAKKEGWAAAILYIAALETWQEGSRKESRPNPTDYFDSRESS